MNQLKVSTRLLWLVGTLIAMLVALGGLGLYGTSQSNAALKTVYEDRTVPATELADIQQRMLNNYFALTLATTDPSPEQIERHTARIETNIAAITKAWQAYMAAPLPPEELVLAKTYADRRAGFVGQGLKPAVAALRSANVAEARRITRDVIPALYDQTEGAMAALLKLHIDVAGQEYAAGVARYESIRLIAIATIVFGIAFAAFFGFWLIRSLMAALGAEPHEVKRLADAVAAGDLTTPITLHTGDSASIMAAMKAMCDNLGRTVSSVRSNADSVATVSA